ncbi:hypothetical protein [Flavisphingomonas formosensis]|uniref:hypothetical protein n=1 Tax=Flavisphingomonas formosensis TaxID=861534 RepID=UPI0012FB29BD|nr:hypothetical protein [Sphingomonas formosensis]
MSHEQPLPEQAVSPYPRDADAQASAKEEALTAAGLDKSDGAGRGKIIGLAAAGAAIGSAAIAAALLYYNRSNKGEKDKTKPKAKRASRRSEPANED